MMDAECSNAEARRRKAYMVAKQIGLKDEERIDLAGYILRRDITSWTQLDDDQIIRMLDALEGFELIVELFAQRPPGGSRGPLTSSAPDGVGSP